VLWGEVIDRGVVLAGTAEGNEHMKVSLQREKRDEEQGIFFIHFFEGLYIDEPWLL
jgi:hypothetical protein